jgi:predicted transcriptional regulator
MLIYLKKFKQIKTIKIMSSKVVGVLLSDEHREKLEIIAEKEYSDKSKLIRKWIDENFKDEYKKDINL